MVNLSSFTKPITEGLKNAFTVKLKEIVIAPLEDFGEILEGLLNDLKIQILSAFRIISLPIQSIASTLSSLGKVFQNLFRTLKNVFGPVIRMFTNMFRQFGKSFVVYVPKTGPNVILFDFFPNFPKTQVAPKMTISMIWSSRSVLPSQNCDAHLFHVEKNIVFHDFYCF